MYTISSIKRFKNKLILKQLEHFYTVPSALTPNLETQNKWTKTLTERGIPRPSAIKL